ncbi:unnamed protein product [Nezara viridula]|uniref:Beclin 1-associated autophagy-related key regulator n=1 Tax=Nezara viridula TaxID=85310 RepID=A0A9P0MS80_NEZVI|nr:unnamed protein product [Nezara viridula]
MNSSSGESNAPLDFHISSSSEDNCKLGMYAEEAEDCPLCFKPGRNFYCKTCINHGEFTVSSGVREEKFSDMKMKFLMLMKEKVLTEKLCEKALANKVKAAQLLSEIEVVGERNNILKQLLEDTKKNISEKEKSYSEAKLQNSIRSVRLLKYRDRVERLKRYVDDKLIERKELITNLIQEQEELKQRRRTNIRQLVTYIFPISVVEPSQKQELHSTVSALEEACQTAFVQGKWISPIMSFERQHRIVAPTLPASGDYSAYNDWVAANKECVPSSSNSNSVDFNPAYNISAALTYTTQLVNMLAFFLDVRLPAKLCYSDFCTHEMSKNKFTKKVARLNWNVLHLCLSQNVDPRLLNPERTLSNLVLLLDQTVSDLGRSSTPDIKPEESRVLEDALRPYLEKDDPDDSGDEGLSYDWEAVPTSNGLPESEPIQNIQSQQISSTSVADHAATEWTMASILKETSLLMIPIKISRVVRLREFQANTKIILFDSLNIKEEFLLYKNIRGTLSNIIILTKNTTNTFEQMDSMGLAIVGRYTDGNVTFSRLPFTSDQDEETEVVHWSWDEEFHPTLFPLDKMVPAFKSKPLALLLRHVIIQRVEYFTL